MQKAEVVQVHSPFHHSQTGIADRETTEHAHQVCHLSSDKSLTSIPAHINTQRDAPSPLLQEISHTLYDYSHAEVEQLVDKKSATLA